MSQPPLPELSQAILEPALLEALVEDLTGLAEVLEVTTKGGACERALAGPSDLRGAVEALCAGQVRGVQVLYRWQDGLWLDTLLRGPEGIRLVRLARH